MDPRRCWFPLSYNIGGWICKSIDTRKFTRETLGEASKNTHTKTHTKKTGSGRFILIGSTVRNYEAKGESVLRFGCLQKQSVPLSKRQRSARGNTDRQHDESIQTKVPQITWQLFTGGEPSCPFFVRRYCDEHKRKRRVLNGAIWKGLIFVLASLYDKVVVNN